MSHQIFCSYRNFFVMDGGIGGHVGRLGQFVGGTLLVAWWLKSSKCGDNVVCTAVHDSIVN